MSLNIKFVLTIASFVLLPAIAESAGYCASFCDSNGYHEARYCHAPELYCCGTSYSPVCCDNQSHELPNYPDKYNCNSDTWMQVHWQVMITMTGSLLLILLFSACCCQCCRICSQSLEHANRVRFDRESSIVTDADVFPYIPDFSGAENAENGLSPNPMFNPESPYAFTPPDYEEQLPKDPPKYSEIFIGMDGGATNAGYIPDSPPPPFTEEPEAAAGPPLPQTNSMRTMESSQSPTSVEYVTESDESNTRHASSSRNSCMDKKDSDGFVEVDLSVDVVDEVDRPLTYSTQPRLQLDLNDEAQELCNNNDEDK